MGAGSICRSVSPPLESALSGWLLARMKRVPFVLEVEDLWPDSIIALGFTNRPFIRWLRFLEAFLYRHSDYILTVAAKMQDYLLQQGVPAAKLTMIPLGANQPENYSLTERNKVRISYGWANDVTVAVYMGAHGPANALVTLIRAAEVLATNPLIKIVLFGDGSDKPRLQQLVQELHLPNISLEDPVAPELVPAILNAADLGIASLKATEIFKTVRPNKLYEYMAVGLPIICCIDGEAARLVTEVETGVSVKPEDHQGLAVAISTLAGDAPYRQILGDNGRNYMKKSGDRAKLAVQMVEFRKR